MKVDALNWVHDLALFCLVFFSITNNLAIVLQYAYEVCLQGKTLTVPGIVRLQPTDYVILNATLKLSIIVINITDIFS